MLGAGAGAACVGAGVGLTPLLVGVAVAVVVAVAPFIRYLVADRADTAAEEHGAPRSGRSPAVAVLAAVAFASFLTEGAAADWSANYSRNVLGTGAGTAALSYAGYSLLMVVTRLGATRLQARFAARRLLPALAVFAAIAMSVTLLLANPAVTVIGFACLGAGLALLVPTAFSAAYSVGNGGSAIAVVAASGWLGYLLAAADRSSRPVVRPVHGLGDDPGHGDRRRGRDPVQYRFRRRGRVPPGDLGQVPDRQFGPGLHLHHVLGNVQQSVRRRQPPQMMRRRGP